MKVFIILSGTDVSINFTTPTGNIKTLAQYKQENKNDNMQKKRTVANALENMGIIRTVSKFILYREQYE